MTPTTTHKGFRIVFSDVMEDWYCQEIGKRSASLKGLKSQIDAHLRKMRKGVAVDAFELDSLFQHQRRLDQDTITAKLKPAKVVEYLGMSTGYTKGIEEVAVIPEGGSRRKLAIRNLIKDTPENHEIIERAHQKGLEAISAINQMNLILDELERLDRKDVDALARMAESDCEE